jgi:hypothetical protein
MAASLCATRRGWVSRDTAKWNPEDFEAPLAGEGSNVFVYWSPAFEDVAEISVSMCFEILFQSAATGTSGGFI